MDIVALWKTISVVLTGAFGVLGSLTESKDRATGALTRWGKISLAGIVVSALGGAVVQWQESQTDARRTREAAEMAVKIAKSTQVIASNTQASVTRLDRILTVLGPKPDILLEMFASCRDPVWGPVCNRLPPIGSTKDALRTAAHPIDVSTLVTGAERRALGADFYIQIWSPSSAVDLIRDPALYEFQVPNGFSEGKIRVTRSGVHDLTVLYEGQAKIEMGRQVLGVVDLPGLTLTAWTSSSIFNHMKPMVFEMFSENGQEIFVDSHSMDAVPGKRAANDPLTFEFQYKIPSSVIGR